MSMNDIYDRLGSMDSKLDRLLASDGDKETRIRSLESWRGKFLGAAGLLAVGVPALVHFIK